MESFRIYSEERNVVISSRVGVRHALKSTGLAMAIQHRLIC